MIVHVHEDSSITLEEPDVFTAFSLRAPRLAPEAVLAAFGADARAGEETGHAWIAIDRLHALGAIHGGADWRERCDKMIEYARTQGWVDASGRFVRAHFES